MAGEGALLRALRRGVRPEELPAFEAGLARLTSPRGVDAGAGGLPRLGDFDPGGLASPRGGLADLSSSASPLAFPDPMELGRLPRPLDTSPLAREARSATGGYWLDEPGYFGTTFDVREMDPARLDIGSWHGKAHYLSSSPADVSRNYAAPTSPDLRNRIGRRTEELLNELHPEGWSWGGPEWDEASARAASELGGTNEGYVIPAYQRMQNPVVVNGGQAGYVRDDYYRMFGGRPAPREPSTFWDLEYGALADEEDAAEEVSGAAVDLIANTERVLNDAGFDETAEVISKLWERAYEYDGLSADAFESVMRTEPAIYMTDFGIEPGAAIQQVYRAMGHDGVVLRNAERQFGMGMPPDTTHYAVFDPENIRSRFANFARRPLNARDLLAGAGGVGAAGLAAGLAGGTFDPASAMPAGGAARGAGRLARELDPLGFYSAVVEATRNYPNARATPAEFLNWLTKQPGVRAEELRWMGVNEGNLTQQLGREPVSREQLVEFMRDRRIFLEEQLLGAPDPIDRSRAGWEAAVPLAEREAEIARRTRMDVPEPTREGMIADLGEQQFRERYPDYDARDFWTPEERAHMAGALGRLEYDRRVNALVRAGVPHTWENMIESFGREALEEQYDADAIAGMDEDEREGLIQELGEERLDELTDEEVVEGPEHTYEGWVGEVGEEAVWEAEREAAQDYIDQEQSDRIDEFVSEFNGAVADRIADDIHDVILDRLRRERPDDDIGALRLEASNQTETVMGRVDAFMARMEEGRGGGWGDRFRYDGPYVTTSTQPDMFGVPHEVRTVAEDPDFPTDDPDIAAVLDEHLGDAADEFYDIENNWEPSDWAYQQGREDAFQDWLNGLGDEPVSWEEARDIVYDNWRATTPREVTREQAESNVLARWQNNLPPRVTPEQAADIAFSNWRSRLPPPTTDTAYGGHLPHRQPGSYQERLFYPPEELMPPSHTYQGHFGGRRNPAITPEQRSQGAQASDPLFWNLEDTWDFPNLGEGGKPLRTLRMLEDQSDLAQAGGREGYEGMRAGKRRMEEWERRRASIETYRPAYERDVVAAAVRAYPDSFPSLDPTAPWSNDEVAANLPLARQLAEATAQGRQSPREPGGSIPVLQGQALTNAETQYQVFLRTLDEPPPQGTVPHHPFMTKGYQEPAIRRLFYVAAERGLDAVAVPLGSAVRWESARPFYNNTVFSTALDTAKEYGLTAQIVRPDGTVLAEDAFAVKPAKAKGEGIRRTSDFTSEAYVVFRIPDAAKREEIKRGGFRLFSTGAGLAGLGAMAAESLYSPTPASALMAEEAGRPLDQYADMAPLEPRTPREREIETMSAARRGNPLAGFLVAGPPGALNELLFPGSLRQPGDAALDLMTPFFPAMTRRRGDDIRSGNLVRLPEEDWRPEPTNSYWGFSDVAGPGPGAPVRRETAAAMGFDPDELEAIPADPDYRDRRFETTDFLGYRPETYDPRTGLRSEAEMLLDDAITATLPLHAFDIQAGISGLRQGAAGARALSGALSGPARTSGRSVRNALSYSRPSRTPQPSWPIEVEPPRPSNAVERFFDPARARGERAAAAIPPRPTRRSRTARLGDITVRHEPVEWPAPDLPITDAARRARRRQELDRRFLAGEGSRRPTRTDLDQIDESYPTDRRHASAYGSQQEYSLAGDRPGAPRFDLDLTAERRPVGDVLANAARATPAEARRQAALDWMRNWGPATGVGVTALGGAVLYGPRLAERERRQEEVIGELQPWAQPPFDRRVAEGAPLEPFLAPGPIPRSTIEDTLPPIPPRERRRRRSAPPGLADETPIPPRPMHIPATPGGSGAGDPIGLADPGLGRRLTPPTGINITSPRRDTEPWRRSGRLDLGDLRTMPDVPGEAPYPELSMPRGSGQLGGEDRRTLLGQGVGADSQTGPGISGGIPPRPLIEATDRERIIEKIQTRLRATGVAPDLAVDNRRGSGTDDAIDALGELWDVDLSGASEEEILDYAARTPAGEQGLKAAQTLLQMFDYYHGRVDGDRGPKTLAAINEALADAGSDKRFATWDRLPPDDDAEGWADLIGEIVGNPRYYEMSLELQAQR